LSIDALLGGDNTVLEELTLRREVQTVVEDLGVVECNELITESTDFSVKDKTFSVDVCSAEAGETGGFVASTGLDADESVLDDIDTSNTMSASDGVSLEEELNCISDGLSLCSNQLIWQALLEHQCEVLRGIWALEGINSQLPHVLRRSNIGVFQDTSLVTAVCQVLVACAADGDTGLGGVVEEIVAACEALVEFGHAPWCDDLDGGLEGVECKFESDLVVTLSSSRGKLYAAFLLGNFELCASNDGAGEGSTSKKVSMSHCVGNWFETHPKGRRSRRWRLLGLLGSRVPRQTLV
jgi:hypothetical protein